MWDVLLATEEEGAGRERFDGKGGPASDRYMGTCRTKITIHGVPAVISENKMGDIFSKYVQVEGGQRSG